jgi:hypothetical protein
MPVYSRRRSASNVEGATLLAVALLFRLSSGLAAPVALADGDMRMTLPDFGVTRLTGAPGSYVLFLGADKVPLEVRYWLDEKTIVAFSGRTVPLAIGGGGGILIDRGLLPTRFVDGPLFMLDSIDYGTLPPAPTGNDTILAIPEVATSYIPAGDEPRATPGPPKTLFFQWTGKETRKTTAGEPVAYGYQARNLVTTDDDQSGPITGVADRVYVPAVDTEVDRSVWEKTADVVVGGGVGSSSNLAVVIAELRPKMKPEWLACVSALAASPEYKAYDGGFSALERRSIPLLPKGLDDVSQFGFNDYRALDARFGMADRFMKCFGP